MRSSHTPVSIADKLGNNWDIEKFEITGLKELENDYQIDYICAGTGDRGLITLFCYDEEGYNVGTFYVGVRTNSGADKFKVEGWTIISKAQ